MPTDLGVWLRQQREARGWTRPEMARRLIQAGHAKGDKSMPGTDSMCHNIYRWERGADRPSERYKLCYCQALAIPLSHFGPQQPDHQPAATQTPETSAMTTTPGLHAAPPPTHAPPPHTPPAPTHQPTGLRHTNPRHPPQAHPPPPHGHPTRPPPPLRPPLPWLSRR